MFTYKDTGHEPLFWIGAKPVYGSFKKDNESRIPPFRDVGKYLGSNDFLERYGLSRKEGAVVQRASSPGRSHQCKASSP